MFCTVHARRSYGVCAVRKSELAIHLAHRRLHRRSSQKRMHTKPETLKLAKYSLVLTIRPSVRRRRFFSCPAWRWQIELAFKRLKSLAQLDTYLSMTDRVLALGYIGKLLVALLVQKAIGLGRDISPRGKRFRASPIGSRWREFNSALHQYRKAIEPQLGFSAAPFPL